MVKRNQMTPDERRQRLTEIGVEHFLKSQAEETMRKKSELSGFPFETEHSCDNPKPTKNDKR